MDDQTPTPTPPASGMRSRREILGLLAASAAAPMFLVGCRDEGAAAVGHLAEHRAAGALAPAVGTEPTFFTEAEFETVRMLADYILPADDRGPSAAEVGVPEFIDFVMTDDLLGDPTDRQTAMRGGLAWVDNQCRRAHGEPFTACTDAQRRALLDRIAYPEAADPADAAGVAFFNRMRDYTAAGYFSSPQGVEDLGYIGNVAVQEWTGCPPEVERHVMRTA